MTSRDREATLLIDADDTLWENNVFFEQAIDRFLELVFARGFSREEGRRSLMEIERHNVTLYGYGSSVFARSLGEALESVAASPLTESERKTIAELGRWVVERPIRFLPGVKKTLRELRERYRLILFTKGDPPEQWRKVKRSGVARLFHHVEVTPEKDREAYLRLVDRYRLDPPLTWMVGNSPRSDIHPALAAGLNAILIPHPRTWELEHEEVQEDGLRLRVLERFEDLLRIL